MDDSLAEGAWHIDPEIRASMRIGRVRIAADRCSWSDVILEAEELLDEDPDHREGLALLGEALLEIGDFELARQVLEHRVALESPREGGDSSTLSGLALAAFQQVDLPAAGEAAREAIRLDGSDARAHHILGLVLEREVGRQGEALSALSAAAALDPVRYPLPVAIAPDEWDEIVGRAVTLLPLRLQSFYDGLSVQIKELPGLEELQQAVPPHPPTVTALFLGEPPDEGDAFHHPPEAVRLFARNLARAGSIEALLHDLAHALQEEALDWLGVELDGLDALADEER
jgi:tetratricopeptide (TPR) repeat protein